MRLRLKAQPDYGFLRNQILLEAGGSAQIQNQNDIREPGWDHTSYRITDQGLNLIYGIRPLFCVQLGFGVTCWSE